MDREYMRTYYRRFYENPCDLVVVESDEFKEKRDLRYQLVLCQDLAQNKMRSSTS